MTNRENKHETRLPLCVAADDWDFVCVAYLNPSKAVLVVQLASDCSMLLPGQLPSCIHGTTFGSLPCQRSGVVWMTHPQRLHR